MTESKKRSTEHLNEENTIGALGFVVDEFSSLVLLDTPVANRGHKLTICGVATAVSVTSSFHGV